MGSLTKEFDLALKEEYKRDKIKAYEDKDNDKILDVEDQCDNSKDPNVNIYGCKVSMCIKVEQVEFNKIINNNEVEIDTSELKDLWSVE